MLKYAGLGWNRLEKAGRGLNMLKYIDIFLNVLELAGMGWNGIDWA